MQQILGKRLVIEYQTAYRDGREVLESARMYLIPPFGSSAGRSRPYNIEPHSEDTTNGAELIRFLHKLRDRTTPPHDHEILAGLKQMTWARQGIKIRPEQFEGYHVRREIPEMTLLPPSWNMLPGRVKSLTSEYGCSRIQNGVYQECICEIDPRNNALVAYFMEADRRIHPEQIAQIGACRDLPHGISKAQANAHAWASLRGIAERIMKTFRSYGAQCAIADLRNALPSGSLVAEGKIPQHLDDRLRLGIVRDYAPEKVVQLPNGGRAILEVGDDVAALFISPTEDEGGSSLSLVFDSQRSPFAPTWEADIEKVHSLMDHLSTTSGLAQQVILERLVQQASNAYDRRCSISHLIGEQAAHLFSSLSEFGSLRLWLPNTSQSNGRLELVQGYERAEITLAHIPDGPENLTAFSSLELLIGPDGTLQIEAKNQLRNRLKVTLSSKSVTTWGGIGNVVSSLAFALSTRDIKEAPVKVHQLFARMVATDPTTSRLSESASQSDYSFPPNNSWERQAFSLASTIAHTAHRYSRGFGDHGARWLDSSRAAAVVDFTPGPYIIHFETNDDSITSVTLEGKAFRPSPWDSLAFFPTLNCTVEHSASELLLRSLPELLSNYSRFSERFTKEPLKTAKIEETQLFEFLVTHAHLPSTKTSPCMFTEPSFCSLKGARQGEGARRGDSSYGP
jgi:hypothetical protein